jgi:hypothetical protein
VRRLLVFASLSSVLAACTLLYGPDESELVGASADAGLPDRAADVPDPFEPHDGGPDADVEVAAPSYVAEVLRDQPSAYWRLRDTSYPDLGIEPQIHEEIERKRTGSRHGTVGLLDVGPFDGGRSMAFAQGFFEFGDRLSFAGRSTFTVELWARKDSLKFAHLVTKQFRGTPKDGYAVYVNANALAFERYVAGEGKEVISRLEPSPVFHHVAAVYDGGQLSLYLDGVVRGVVADTREQPSTERAPFLIGVSDVSATLESFEGALSEVAIYDHALPAERIRDHVLAATKP